MRPEYDAVVIGAGPAGSMAAYEIAAAGFSVVLLEKNKQPGKPVCCAEAVPQASFKELIKPDPNWICTNIDKAKLVGPEGDEVTATYPNGGYILSREKFDYFLARRAVDAGTDLRTEAIGLKLKGNDKKFTSLDMSSKGDKITGIKASVFIAADGVESAVARSAGIDNLIKFSHVESLLQYRLEKIAIDPTVIEFFVGRTVAPGGYIWVFPKSKNSANVGLGIQTKSVRGEYLKTLLESFIERRFGDYEIVVKSCGMTPKYQGRNMFRKDNLLVVGDAARALDSFSGAGINNALSSGKEAGLAAVEYLSGRVKNYDQLEKLYPGRFLDNVGEDLILYKKLRNVYEHLDDGDFTDIVRALKEHFDKRGTQGIRVGQLLAGLVITRPRLLRLARYLI